MPPPPAAPAPTPVRWQVTLLGGLSLARAGNADTPPITHFRMERVALLLARLALFPARVHSRGELAALLTPDAPDAATERAYLSQALTYLRRVLEPAGTPRGAVLIADAASVCAALGTLVSDAARFEAAVAQALRVPDPAAAVAALREADALYAGELLPGFYAEWVEDERNRLAARRADAAARRAKLEAVLPPTVPGALPPALVRLPHPLTRYFGREGERRDLEARLGAKDGARLVTLTGGGGIGKTRLATEVARSLAARGAFADAVFIALSEARQADALPGALAAAVGCGARESPLDAVRAWLRTRPPSGRTLFVLDNCEQFEGGIASVLRSLLDAAPRLAILATSRSPLGAYGEQEFPLSPLPGVAGGMAGVTPTPDDLLACPDVCLFAARARLVRPEFAVTAANAGAVVAVCRILEGVPLAIELAAARARVLSPAQIAERLVDRFDLLVRRDKNGGDGERHQSLRAALAWSYDLLAPNLKTFFGALSVFRGGFTLEATTAVTGVSDALDPLTLLCERSLVLCDGDEGGSGAEMRYRLLESLREFANEQLTTDERHELYLRHVAHYAGAARACAADTATDWLSPELRRENANTEAAVGYALELGDGDGAADTAGHLWHRLGSQESAVYRLDHLQQTLARCEMLSLTPAARQRLTFAVGHIAYHHGRFDLARAALETVRELAYASGDEGAWCTATHSLGSTLRHLGDPVSGAALHEAALAACPPDDDTNLLSLRNTMAANALMDGDYERADDLFAAAIVGAGSRSGTLLPTLLANRAYLCVLRNRYEEMVPLLDAVREWSRASGHSSMLGFADQIEGFGACRREDWVVARRLAGQSLRTFVETGEERRQIESMAMMGQAIGATDPLIGARLVGAASALAASRFALEPEEQVVMDATAVRLRAALGDAAFEAATGEGARWTLAEAVERALGAEEGAGR